MGRNSEAYRGMGVDPGAVLRVLRSIDAANAHRAEEFLDELSRLTAVVSRRAPRQRAAMHQTWRRWLTGQHLPHLREASAIVCRSQERQWTRNLQPADLRVVRRLVKVESQSNSPVRPYRSRPLGRLQPMSPAESTAWLERVSFVEVSAKRLFAEVLNCASSVPMKQLSSPVANLQALYRAAMHEYVCRTVELFGQRGSSIEPRQSIFDSHIEWPTVLRATADDLRTLIYEAAVKVEQGADVNEATSFSRRRLFAHPESMEFRPPKKRRPRMAPGSDL